MYIVCRISDFDATFKAATFSTRKEAMDFLQANWEDCFNTLVAREDMSVDDDLTYHEDAYAILSSDDGYRMEWFLMQSSNEW